LDHLVTDIRDYGQVALDYLSQPSVLIQLGLIAFLLFASLFLSKHVRPGLEARTRQIKGQAAILRTTVGFLRRLKWIFFAVLLSLAYLVTRATNWPENYLTYSVMLLSGAWVLVSVVSQIIRSRAIRKLVAVVAWTYVAVTILGIGEDSTGRHVRMDSRAPRAVRLRDHARWPRVPHSERGVHHT